MQKQYSSKGQRDVKIDSFEGGLKTCNVCREKGRRQYHNNREKCAERNKQFKENNPENTKNNEKNEWYTERKNIPCSYGMSYMSLQYQTIQEMKQKKNNRWYKYYIIFFLWANPPTQNKTQKKTSSTVSKKKFLSTRPCPSSAFHKLG